LKTNCKQTDKSHTSSGVAFISNLRVFYREDFTKKLYDFPLDKISSIGSRSGLLLGTVSFCTQTHMVELKVPKEAAEIIRQILIFATACGRENVQETTSLEAKYKVVECKGCTAAVVVPLGGIAYCDYCGRPVG